MTTATNGTKKTTKKTATKNRMADAVVSAPNFQLATFRIVGTSPYVQNKFSGGEKAGIIATQAAGSTAKGKKKREPKDFDKAYEGATHFSEDGWCGIPAPAFRCAMIDACRLVGFTMTRAKLAVFCEPDGFDEEDGTPLVRIHGTRVRHDGAVRNANGSCDIRSRPMWKKWHADVTIRFDADQFTIDDVSNLLLRAGQQVGIGEGRHNSRSCFGMGWGTFVIGTK